MADIFMEVSVYNGRYHCKYASNPIFNNHDLAIHHAATKLPMISPCTPPKSTQPTSTIPSLPRPLHPPSSPHPQIHLSSPPFPHSSSCLTPHHLIPHSHPHKSSNTPSTSTIFPTALFHPSIASNRSTYAHSFGCSFSVKRERFRDPPGWG